MSKTKQSWTLLGGKLLGTSRSWNFSPRKTVVVNFFHTSNKKKWMWSWAWREDFPMLILNMLVSLRVVYFPIFCNYRIIQKSQLRKSCHMLTIENTDNYICSLNVAPLRKREKGHILLIILHISKIFGTANTVMGSLFQIQ